MQLLLLLSGVDLMVEVVAVVLVLVLVQVLLLLLLSRRGHRQSLLHGAQDELLLLLLGVWRAGRRLARRCSRRRRGCGRKPRVELVGQAERKHFLLLLDLRRLASWLLLLLVLRLHGRHGSIEAKLGRAPKLVVAKTRRRRWRDTARAQLLLGHAQVFGRAQKLGRRLQVAQVRRLLLLLLGRRHGQRPLELQLLLLLLLLLLLARNQRNQTGERVYVEARDCGRAGQKLLGGHCGGHGGHGLRGARLLALGALLALLLRLGAHRGERLFDLRRRLLLFLLLLLLHLLLFVGHLC